MNARSERPPIQTAPTVKCDASLTRHLDEVLALVASGSLVRSQVVLDFEGAQAIDDRTACRLLGAGASD